MSIPIQGQTPNPNPIPSPKLATDSTSGQAESFTCEACGESFSSQDERQKHNEDQHVEK